MNNINRLKLAKTGSSKLQNVINTSIIFNHIRENSPISRADIARNLKISAPAVSRVINKLINKEYVVESEKAKTNIGKRPTLLEYNKKKGTILGIDLGKERLRASIVNYNLETILSHEGFKILNEKTIEKKLVQEIKKLFNNTKKKDLKAIGIAIPSMVDINSGKILGKLETHMYPNWSDINFKTILENEFNVPVFIENDVNLAAIAEKRFGQGKNFSDQVFIEISEGIGMGLIIDNKLLRGNYGFAGEIGFMITDTRKFYSGVKYKDYAYNYITVRSLKEQAMKRTGNGEKSIILEIANNNAKKISADTVCLAAIKGDALAQEIINNLVNMLALSIISIVLIVNPQIVIIGGEILDLPEADHLFLNPLKKKVSNNLPFKPPDIKFSAMGKESGVYGATYQAYNSLTTSEFPYSID